MAKRITDRDLAVHLGCLLTSIAVHVTVDKGFHLICDIVPVLAIDPFLMFQLAGVVDVVTSSLVLAAAQLKNIFSCYLLIRTTTELTVELSLAAAFIPREQSNYVKYPLGKPLVRQLKRLSFTKRRNEIAKHFSSMAEYLDSGTSHRFSNLRGC